MSTTTTDPTTSAPASQAAPAKSDNGLGMEQFLKPTDPAPPAPVTAKADPVKEEPKAVEPPVEAKPEGEKLEKLEKQLKDTRNAFTQERQTNKQLLTKMQDLERNLSVITKKLDGTYDERTDGPKQFSAEELQQQAEARAAVRTSHFAAVEYLMARDGLTEEAAKTKVEELVWNDDAPFQELDKDPAIHARVMTSRVPVIEAMKVVQETEAKKKYGSDPVAMHKAIEREIRPTIEKEVREKVLKELKGKGVVLDELKGLGDVRSVSPERAPAPAPSLTLESLFPNFKP